MPEKSIHIGVSSYSYNRPLNNGMSVFKMIDHVKETGFDYIEFTNHITFDAEEVAKYVKDKGLYVCSYTVGADLINGDVNAEVVRLKGCLDVANVLGAPFLRHDIAWSLGAGCKSWRDVVAKTVDPIREVADYAQSLGIRTMTENHGYLLQDSERVEALILAVNHENFGWLIDLGNFMCADEAPEYATGIAIPYAFHVHAKDFLFKSGAEGNPGADWFPTRGGNFLRGTVVGHGVVPIKQQMAMLKNSGYKGGISVEFEGAEEALPAVENGYKYLKRLI
jgi:sugar phosphate isomerase/epimerase